MRITIKYKTWRLRNLQRTESIKCQFPQTACVIKYEYEDKVDQNGNVYNVDYDCIAETLSSCPLDEDKIDVTKSMVIETETTNVSVIAFSED